MERKQNFFENETLLTYLRSY